MPPVLFIVVSPYKQLLPRGKRSRREALEAIHQSTVRSVGQGGGKTRKGDSVLIRRRRRKQAGQPAADGGGKAGDGEGRGSPNHVAVDDEDDGLTGVITLGSLDVEILNLAEKEQERRRRRRESRERRDDSANRIKLVPSTGSFTQTPKATNTARSKSPAHAADAHTEEKASATAVAAVVAAAAGTESERAVSEKAAFFDGKEAGVEDKDEEDEDEDEEDDEEDEEDFEVDIFELLTSVLRGLRVNNRISQPIITESKEKEFVQALFNCDRAHVSTVLDRLQNVGIGSETGAVNIVPLEWCVRPVPAALPRSDTNTSLAPSETGADHQSSGDGGRATPRAPGNAATSSAAKTGPGGAAAAGNGDGTGGGKSEGRGWLNTHRMKQDFLEAASVVRVEQVVEQIQASAVLSFDFLCLVMIASTLAGIGLAFNNTVVIVASMLVSPLMGPILAGVFGVVIKDRDLWRLGVASEFFALLLSIVVGALVGLVTVAYQETDHSVMWPTEEMTSRGEVSGLLVGAAIAIPSGIGVALSVLGNNTSSLVGVAISASLLPPAVAAGMQWTYALLRSPDGEDTHFWRGTVSFLLVAVNIFCIFVSAFAMFRLKEVTPMQHKTPFWATDLNRTRMANEAQYGTNSDTWFPRLLLRRRDSDADDDDADDDTDGGMDATSATGRHAAFKSMLADQLRERALARHRSAAATAGVDGQLAAQNTIGRGRKQRNYWGHGTKHGRTTAKARNTAAAGDGPDNGPGQKNRGGRKQPPSWAAAKAAAALNSADSIGYNDTAGGHTDDVDAAPEHANVMQLFPEHWFLSEAEQAGRHDEHVAELQEEFEATLPDLCTLFGQSPASATVPGGAAVLDDVLQPVPAYIRQRYGRRRAKDDQHSRARPHPLRFHNSMNSHFTLAHPPREAEYPSMQHLTSDGEGAELTGTRTAPPAHRRTISAESTMGPVVREPEFGLDIEAQMSAAPGDAAAPEEGGLQISPAEAAL